MGLFGDTIRGLPSAAVGLARKATGYIPKASGVGTTAIGKAIPATRGFLKGQSDIQQMLGSMKKGGKVKKTGMYRLHEGERVLTEAKTKALAKKKMDKEC